MTDRQLTEINRVAASPGREPALDTVILRLHTETACRRGGALALRPCGINIHNCTAHLRARRRSQHLTEYDQLLARQWSSDPLHAVRSALEKAQLHLSWISALGITAHWIRYTTPTWVERNDGYGVAATFAGHAAGYPTGTTLTYVAAPIEELAAVGPLLVDAVARPAAARPGTDRHHLVGYEKPPGVTTENRSRTS